MNKQEFEFLVVNVSAIMNQTFSLRCLEYDSAVTGELSSQQSKSQVDFDKQHNQFDYQSILDSGYNDINELTAELNDAWELIEVEFVEQLVSRLPTDLSNLKEKIGGEQLKLWIEKSLSDQINQELADLYQCINDALNNDEEIQDLIKEAIAFDNIEEIIDEQDNLKAKHIELDDLITAAKIRSYKAFEWLLPRAELNANQMVELFAGCFLFAHALECICKFSNASSEVLQAAQERAKQEGADSAVQFFNDLQVSGESV